MFNICVICMCPFSLEPLSVEHREILESLVSASVNSEQLRNTRLLVCSSCVSSIKALVKFRETAIAGVTHFLHMWSKENKLIEVILQDNITISESTHVSDTNVGMTFDHTEQAPSLKQTEETTVFTHSKPSSCLSNLETPAITTEAVTDMPTNYTSKTIAMEEIYLNRLIQIMSNIKGLASSSRALCGFKSWNPENEVEAKVLSSKLQALLDRFNNELHQYYSLSQDLNADEISRMTSDQLEAEEELVELNFRIQVKRDKVVTTYSSAIQVENQAELPELVLPTFSGDILQWTQYWSQFCCMIDQRDLRDIVKMQYLKASLRGEATTVLEGFETTDDNYKIAVAALTERYGRKTQLVDAHYSALNKVKRAENQDECRKTLNEIEKHLRVLDSLGENIENRYLKLVIMEKFPAEVIYQVKLKMSKESVEEIRNQLNVVLSAREACMRTVEKSNEEDSTETLHKRKTMNAVKTHKRFKPGANTQTRFHNIKEEKEGQNSSQKRRKLSCIFCKGDHFNDECMDSGTIEERKSKLKDHCYNCLHLGHSVNTCRFNSTCYHCGKRGHNRALCHKRESAKK